jgi:hypothetical protein
MEGCPARVSPLVGTGFAKFNIPLGTSEVFAQMVAHPVSEEFPQNLVPDTVS